VSEVGSLAALLQADNTKIADIDKAIRINQRLLFMVLSPLFCKLIIAVIVDDWQNLAMSYLAYRRIGNSAYMLPR